MKVLASTLLLAFCVSSAEGALITHYTFDTDGTAAAGSNAVLGNGASITTTGAAVGAGALQISGQAVPDRPGADGAVSLNTFNWSNDIRTISFWVKLGTQSDSSPTMLSLGGGATAGSRMDLRLISGSVMVMETGAGLSYSSTDLGNGGWNLIVIIVPKNGAILSDVIWYNLEPGGDSYSSGNFIGSDPVNTLGGPLRLGDSALDSGRDFVGLIDDVRIYDTALNTTEVRELAALYGTPEPSSALLGVLGILPLLRRRR